VIVIDDGDGLLMMNHAVTDDDHDDNHDNDVVPCTSLSM
jgi:hypothetical protein